VIVISTYNPDTKRTTQDEELLTSLLTALIAYRKRCDTHRPLSKDEAEETYWREQAHNSDRLIGLVYPLLGLDLHEVLELLKD
jgi:hypothetical protein